VDTHLRFAQADWESVARFVVGAFRAETARAGATEDVSALVDELSRASPDFARMWNKNEVRPHGSGMKELRHPVAGPITLEYSAFAVDGRTDLTLIVYNPATPEDKDKISRLLASAS